jgi:hypothetical protein
MCGHSYDFTCKHTPAHWVPDRTIVYVPLAKSIQSNRGRFTVQGLELRLCEECVKALEEGNDVA